MHAARFLCFLIFLHFFSAGLSFCARVRCLTTCGFCVLVSPITWTVPLLPGPCVAAVAGTGGSAGTPAEPPLQPASSLQGAGGSGAELRHGEDGLHTRAS